jgi:hypothetical protein
MLKFKILSIFLVPGSQNRFQKCRQMCSTKEFTKLNSRILPFIVGICMGGTLGMSYFKILSIFMVRGPKYSYQKSHQICSMRKFSNQNSRFLPFLGGIYMRGTLWMSNFKILSIFLVSGPQYSYQKYHQICSTGKFA